EPGETAAWWLIPDRFFDGEEIREGLALRIADGRVERIAPASDAGKDAAPVWHAGGLLSPGYFDLQVNGGGGVLYNATPTPEGLYAIAAAHRATGTTAILPTFITDTADALDRAVDAMLVAHGRNGVAGMHIEGPHISVERKGTHNRDYIRPIDARTFASVERLRAAKVPVLLTLAPEVNPAGSVAKLVAMGVVVSIGHSNGDAKSTRQAIAEGARSATHLYNAMTPMQSREPGVVGAALDSDLYCGFIADGHHVDDAVLRLAFRSRPV
ncbi:N-acetylglucosamine-6-phosphate deacetylase, partial [Salmonella enterica subsp. enterica]|nr:N-acetylglucosamine-6-phosphate deacetylase [Salmonella enterica subsp. enterica]